MDAPSWLEALLFQKILRKFEKNGTIEVSSISIKPAVAKGDNYMSNLFRANVEFSRIVKGRKTSETKSLIAKLLPDGGAHEQLVMETGFFDIEIAMMSQILPRMNKILQDHSIGVSLAAQCLHVQSEKPIFLILEDLVANGFRMVDRQAGLDLDHCLLAVKNLAVFHASSVALVEKDPDVSTKFTKGLFHKDRSPSWQMSFCRLTKVLGKEVAKWPELSPRVAEKILKLSDVIYKKTSEIAACEKDDFNVINHGDFRVNNMLFRYDEQRKLIDHTFVDFQICHYASPVMDLLYFIGTSPSDKVRMNDREVILREYHISLTKIMIKLKCSTEPPSFDELMEALKKRALYEVVSAFTILPVDLVDKSDVRTVNEAEVAGENYDFPMYKSKLYREVMTRLLPIYDSMGLLDV